MTTLIQYRDEITRTLPPLTLKDTNLEEELLLQFQTVRALQAEVINNDDVPANQRAQVANSVASTLNKLVEMQEMVYTQERFKSLESLLIKHIQNLPQEVTEAFLADYETLLTSSK